MHILLISDLPEFLDLFGLGHHYPPVPTVQADGMTFTRIGRPGLTGADGPPDQQLDKLVAGNPGGGPVVAHVSGTTGRSARIAEGLAARKVPFLYSPMLPSYPSRLLEILGRFPGIRVGALEDLLLAAAIAPAARMILAPDTLSHGSLKRVLRMPTGRLHRVEGPGTSGPALRNIGGAFSNLAVAFCDSVIPEWNLLHFLYAMEKINADAVVVAGRTEGEYARSCADRAAQNPRVKFLTYDPGGIGAIAGEIGSVLDRASVVVDPSLRGLGGGAITAATEAGVPAVISRSSARVLPQRDRASRVQGYHMDTGRTFTFEPSSWELLHHAITCAFNAAAGVPTKVPGGPGTGAPTEEPDHSTRNAAIAATLREMYQETAARG